MNKHNPYARLVADDNANKWWQTVLDDPRFAVVVEAAKHQLDQSPEQFAGVDAIQMLALLYAAKRGGDAAFAMLETLGAATFAEQRAADGQQALSATLITPARAGTGAARHSPPPPEIVADLAAAHQPPAANG